MPPLTEKELEAARARIRNAKEMEAAGNSAVRGFSTEQTKRKDAILEKWAKKIKEPEYKAWQKQLEKQEEELKERGVVRVNATMNHNPEPVVPKTKRRKSKMHSTANTQLPREYIPQPAKVKGKPFKLGNKPISKQFSYEITGHFWSSPENIATVHFLYEEAVLKNKIIYTKGDLSRLLNNNRKPTKNSRERAAVQIEKLKAENLSFVRIEKIDDNYQIVFKQDLIDDTTVPGRFQYLQNDFVQYYGGFYRAGQKNFSKIEIGGVLLLIHYILPNKHHASFSDKKPHRIYFRTLIQNGCFSKYLVQRKNYSKMRNALKERFKIFQTLGFVDAVSFSMDLKPGSGGSGSISWTNKVKAKSQPPKLELKKFPSSDLHKPTVLKEALGHTLELVKKD